MQSARLHDASKQDMRTINKFRYRLNNYTESKAANKTVNCSQSKANFRKFLPNE